MEPSSPQLLGKAVNETESSIWTREIRDYLLGRLSSNFRMVPLTGLQRAELETPRVLRWWIFEGKRYATLCGPLAQNWDWVIRNAKRLIQTLNPRLRLSMWPDGVVDWGQTLARSPYGTRQEYVVRSSAIGLNEEEYAALCGWIRWIEIQWAEYTQCIGVQSHIQWPTFASEMQGPFPAERLRRWAHIARRSRWPLLQGIVAESLRPALETEELDRIPLPSDEAALFELLCLVRLARNVAPLPRELRWLIPEEEIRNQITLDGVRIAYQERLGSDSVLATYEPELASAAKFFSLATAKRIDITLEFKPRRADFDGVIVEAKSGAQQYDDTVAQLRTYRAARPRRPGSRYLVWGIVQKPQKVDATAEVFEKLFAAADKAADVWVFSSADAIATVLTASGIAA
jgi:hypothetical protein